MLLCLCEERDRTLSLHCSTVLGLYRCRSERFARDKTRTHSCALQLSHTSSPKLIQIKDNDFHEALRCAATASNGRSFAAADFPRETGSRRPPAFACLAAIETSRPSLRSKQRRASRCKSNNMLQAAQQRIDSRAPDFLIYQSDLTVLDIRYLHDFWRHSSELPK